MYPYVFRRPFDYRAPKPSWLLLRPDLNVDASAAALTLTGHPATVELSGVAGHLTLTGHQAGIAFLDTTAFTFRDVPGIVPDVRPGVFRGGFTVRRPRVPIVIPRKVSSGDIAANRAQLVLQGQPATIGFNEAIRLWVLQDAVRAATLRRQLVYREPLDMAPWQARFGQFTVPTRNLTAYAGTLTLTGHQSVTQLSRGVAAQVAHLSLVAPQAAVRLGKSINANAASLTLTGQQARVSSGRTVDTTAATLTLAGQTSDTDYDRSIQAGTASLVMSALAASIGPHLNIAANVAVLVLTPHRATGQIENAVAALTAELVLSAHAADVSLSNAILATEAELALTGSVSEVHFGNFIDAVLAELSLEGRTALIEGTQAVIIQIGRRTVRVRARNSTITVH